MKSKIHPRILKLMDFYDREPKVCKFMKSEYTNFILIPDGYKDEHIKMPILNFAKTKDNMALAYVLEVDPPSLERERTNGIDLFGNLLRILKEDETGEKINKKYLTAELNYVFSDACPGHPHLSYKDEGFYMITMGLIHFLTIALSKPFGFGVPVALTILVLKTSISKVT